MKTAQRPAGQYLNPHITEARVSQTWANIVQRRPFQRRTPVVVQRSLLAAVSLAIALCVFGLMRRSPLHESSSDTLTITSDAKPRSLELMPGAQLELQPHSSAVIARAQPSEQRVAIVRGAVVFRIVHDPLRHVIVSAGSVEVTDIGTVFTVAREGKDGELVRVAVSSGEVEVRVPGHTPRPLHEGEVLVTPEIAGPPPLVSQESYDAVAPPRLLPSATHIDTQGEPVAASASAARTVESLSAKSLLADAAAARQAGSPSAEAHALDTLRRRFPHDSRVPIAAFELGRVRMDQLGNRAGALEALRAAIAASPGASFREDAEARIVVLLEQLGDTAGCRAARDAFLSRYSASIHRASLQRRCPAP